MRKYFNLILQIYIFILLKKCILIIINCCELKNYQGNHQILQSTQHTDFDDFEVCYRGHNPNYYGERFTSNGPYFLRNWALNFRILVKYTLV